MFGKDNKAIAKALGVRRTEWETIIYKWENYSCLVVLLFIWG